MSDPTVFNMPSGAAFLPSLAKGLREIYGERLQDALILLPTRRAVRALGDAFVGDSGASLLPRMRPLADINPEEPPFEPGELVGLVKPAIDPMQRRFEMAQIIGRYHKNISDLPLDPTGALALADPLIAILDDAAMEEADISRITELEEIKDFAAVHFQNAITLYKIIQDYWPQRLADLDLMEPFARRVALLNALTDIWVKEPPKYPVIIAGSTGTLGASARLMRCVARLEEGMVILPGLENLKTVSWDKIGPQHPQNSLKQLIEIIGIDRVEVKQWDYINPPNTLDARRRIISEALVPVQDTGDWPGRIKTIRESAAKGVHPFTQALEGLSVIEAANDEEEALTIALIMREVLETPDKTAALVTPDPALARRVKARLRRWSVNVDYSQGQPLEETALGSYLARLMALAIDPLSPVDLSVVFKHRLTAMGQQAGFVRKMWQAAEPKLRGVRSEKKLAALDVFTTLQVALAPLMDLDVARAPLWARALTQAAETLADTDEIQGAARLWIDDAGEKAAGLLEGLMAHGDHLPEMSAAEFAKLLSTLMRGRVVRPHYGTHPRLSILGPLEARMLTADRIILGGLNEGIWPTTPSAEPFLSRGMRKSLGLSLPERRFGLSAHDFAELAANPGVIMTRSKRSDDGPKVASRWLWRLQTLMQGALRDEAIKALSKSDHYLAWARVLDYVAADKVKSVKPPEHRPPIEARWPKGRQLSITQIKTWIRDPYSIYARHILALRPLDDLDMPLGVRDYGNAVHKGLEMFVDEHRKKLPADAAKRLVHALETAMENTGYPDFQIAKEAARLEKIAVKMVNWMTERRAAGWDVAGVETDGRLTLPVQNFTLTGKTDLIEKGPQGFAVTDYKTGAPSSVKVVKSGFDPQLPLTAYMLGQGAFETLGAGKTAELTYIRVKGSGDETLAHSITNPPNPKGHPAADYEAEAIKALSELIAAYDKPETAYHSQPRAQFTHDYSDYDHLARRDEWARLGKEGPGDE